MTESSPVADHCSTHSLNDSKDAEYKTPCNHTHDRVCSSCEELKEVLLSIKNVLNEVKGNEDELEDLKYDHNHAVQEIQSWKAHQLRSVRQDKARSEILDALDESSVFITQDWAMKFLPQKYRESQSDWFGKRGISWHISVAVRKKHNVLQSQSFVHVAENSDQDSFLVVRIIEHVLRTLKAEHAELQTAFLRQDNAGCYHSALMLAACSLMAKRTGIRVGRVDFSDPQGGKGACDRQAASIKAHVRRFINEGHDVNSAQDFKEAMMSRREFGLSLLMLTLLCRKPLTHRPNRRASASKITSVIQRMELQPGKRTKLVKGSFCTKVECKLKVKPLFI